MKYMRTLWYILAVGFIAVGILFAAKMLCVIMAFIAPVVDAVIEWMYDNAIVGGVMLAVAFLVWWFGDECDRQREKERGRKC